MAKESGFGAFIIVRPMNEDPNGVTHSNEFMSDWCDLLAYPQPWNVQINNVETRQKMEKR